MDLKYNLLLSYATYLTFYLLLRVDGASNDTVKDHPVLFKVTTLKKTLDGLRGLDEKLEKVLERKAKGKDLLLGKRKQLEENKIDDEDQSLDEDKDESYGEELGEEEEGEEDFDNDEFDEDDNVVDTDALLTKSD